MFRKHYLGIMMGLSILALLLLPAFISFYLTPLFSDFIIEKTEQDAARLAKHLSSSLLAETPRLQTGTLPESFTDELKALKNDIGFEKVKIYSPFGEIIYSTNPEEIGTMNTKPYFHEIVAKGNPYTKMVKKDTKTLEGRLAKADVVETYVPILSGGEFKGAFEIYYDITASKASLDGLIFRSNRMVFIIMLGLFALVMLSSLQARKSIAERDRIEKDLREHRDHLEKIVQERTAEIMESNLLLQRDIADRKQVEEALRVSEDGLRKSIREKDLLLREVHHRVKNNMQIISSLLKLQAVHVKDQSDKELFQESQNRIKSMALVHSGIYQSDDLTSVDLSNYVHKLCTALYNSYRVPHSRVALFMDVQNISLGIDVAIPCGLILNELVSNALKHAFPEGRAGRIRISIRSTDGTIEMLVSDDGVGLPEDFDLRTAKSFGLQLVLSLAESQLNGTVQTDTAQGTGFKIRFSKVDYKSRL